MKNNYIFLTILTILALSVEASPKELYIDLLKRNLMGSFKGKRLTLLSIERLNNIQACVEDTILNNIPGDLIETGVWQGGAVILMKAILKANNSDKVVWCADSYQGLPKISGNYAEDQEISWLADVEELKVSLEEVQKNFLDYGLLDKNVNFLKGWFKDTLPHAPIEKLAVLRLDGDYYESTMDALVHLYPKLSIGGYIIIDDYGHFPACAKAVNDYRNANSINEDIKWIDYTGVFWRKEK